MKKTRDTTGKLDVDQASRALKRLEKTLERRVGRLPGGKYAIVVSSMVTGGTHGGVQCAFRVVGDHVLKRAIETHAVDVQNTMTNIDSMLPSSDFFLSMPGNAEGRARRLRSILSTAWKYHVEGTPFVAKKQMYSVVKSNPGMAFPWWAEIARVPFANTAIDNADVSARIFRYIAPRVYTMMKSREFSRVNRVVM
jgi:hypothetical protein